MAEPDLSKIVGLIMENPELIEQIKNLGLKNEKEDNGSSEEIVVSEKDYSEKTEPPKIEESQNTSKIRRKELLYALKAYVSEERGRAIESMLSVADILDMIRSR